MKKDIQWLKEEVEKRIKTIESDDISFVGSEYYDEGYIDGMRDVLYRINQLDEPEVLSQEWISEHAYAVAYDGMPDQTEVVYVDDLQNLLVPTLSEMETDERTQLETAYKDILDRGEFWFDDKRYMVVGEEQKYYVLDSDVL